MKIIVMDPRLHVVNRFRPDLAQRAYDDTQISQLMGDGAIPSNAMVFTALHGMQTRSSDENSVCPSLRPSVRPSHA